MVSNAYSRVPEIKPNCTEEVMAANADDGKCKVAEMSATTALPANHKAVQQNCAMIITGSTFDAVAFMYWFAVKITLIRYLYSLSH
jgi:hypothetical protein